MSHDAWVPDRLYATVCQSPTILVQTSWSEEWFTNRMGKHNIGWATETFRYKGLREWGWSLKNTTEAVKAAVIRNRVVLAISSAESYYKFLAFVVEREMKHAKAD